MRIAGFVTVMVTSQLGGGCGGNLYTGRNMKTKKEQLYVKKEDYDELMIDAKNLAEVTMHKNDFTECKQCEFALKFHFALMNKLNDSNYKICDTLENLQNGSEGVSKSQLRLL